MKIYNFKDINNCVVCGCINNSLNIFMDNVKEKLSNKKSIINRMHPKEIERQERLKNKICSDVRNRYVHDILDEFDMPRPTFKKMPHHTESNEINSYNDTIIIVSGGCGIGGNEISTYLARFEEFNKALADNNCYVLFVRGEKDDPQIFENEEINLSNIKTIQDYSIIQFKSFNCLCIGGSISLDREWKKQQEKRIGKKMYWENEGFKYKEKELDEILSQYDIACIVSNIGPSFAFPGTNSFNRTSWTINDKALLKDILEERKLMDKVYERIMKDNKKPFVWFYSKYKINNNSTLNDIVFLSLGKQECLSFNNIVSSNFGINFETTLSFNEEIINELTKKMDSFRYDMPWTYEREEEDNDGLNIEEIEDPFEEENNNELLDVGVRRVYNR